MTNSNWRSTIGGAFSALGKTLMGVGIVPQLSGMPNKALTYLAIAGFVLDAIGSFFGHLFGADAKTVSDLGAQVVANTTAIATTAKAAASGDTALLTKVASTPIAVSIPETKTA